jgi:hypothetical protein
MWTAALIYFWNGCKLKPVQAPANTKETQSMARFLKNGLLSALLSVFIAIPVCAQGKEDKSPTTLEVSKSTQKLEVRDSQIGYRDTLLFYTFTDQKAVLKLRIDNKDMSFPMAGTIYVFAESVGEDDLKKWLNNQHSDGIFPDVPEPIKSYKLPAIACKAMSYKLIDRSKQSFGEYDIYSVAFEVKEYSDKKGVALKGFADTAKVSVRTK